jgi:hypothetical protein
MQHTLGGAVIKTALLLQVEEMDVYHHYTSCFIIQRRGELHAHPQTSKKLFPKRFSDHILTDCGLYDPR